MPLAIYAQRPSGEIRLEVKDPNYPCNLPNALVSDPPLKQVVTDTAVLNLGAHYQVLRRWQLFAQINNLLDRHYYSAAQLGPTPFDNNGAFVAQPFPAVDGNYPIRTTTFFAPGAPINVFEGMRFTF